MKAKLLKKVRERFSIEYCPKGITVNGYNYCDPYIVVVDSKYKNYVETIRVATDIKDLHDSRNDWTPKFMLEDAKVIAYRNLVWAIRKEYLKYGTRRIEVKKIKEKKEAKEAAEEKVRIEKEQKEATQKLWYDR